MKKLLIIALMFFSLQVHAEWIFDEISGAWYNTETGEIRITGDDDMDGDVGSIFLYTGTGQVLNNNLVSIVYNPDNKEYWVSTKGLPHGDYILVIQTVGGGSKVIRFVI